MLIIHKAAELLMEESISHETYRSNVICEECGNIFDVSFDEIVR